MYKQCCTYFKFGTDKNTPVFDVTRPCALFRLIDLKSHPVESIYLFYS